MFERMLISVFAALLIVLLFVSESFAIKCWVCRSDEDPKCADPFDNSTLPIVDCKERKLSHLFVPQPEEHRDGYNTRYNSGGQLPGTNRVQTPRRPLLESTMCRKIRQKIHGNWRTIRSCAFLGQPGEGTGNEHHCLIRQGTHDIYVEYCTCNSKDGCNLSNIPHVHLLVIFFTLGISFFLLL